MKTPEYWQRRAEINAQIEHKKADQYTGQLIKEYRKATDNVIREIEVFYARFAQNNTVTLPAAKKLLDKGELEEFKMTLEEFTAKARNNADGKWTQQLNNVYYRTRVSRYEALLIRINQELELITGRQQTGFKALLSGNYNEAYYRTLYEIQKGNGIGVTFAGINDTGVERVLTTNWAGSNFSSRIWDNRDKLARELQTNLTQSFIRGDDLQKTIHALQDRFKVSESNAARLVRTESAHIASEATFEGYKASRVVKQFEFLATLDSLTSAVCRSMDNLVFDLSDKQVGVNAPPLHTNCRSTTVANFGDDDIGERIARDTDGQVYFVPDSMGYEQWHEKYVPKQPANVSNPKADKLIDYENEIRNKPVEYSAIFDPKGRKIWESSAGTESEVSILEAVQSGKLSGNVITHNHPTDNASFSRNDIKILAQEEAAEMRAVTEAYNYSAQLTDTYKKLQHPNKLQSFNSKIDELFTGLIKKYRGQIADKKMSVDEATYALQHDLWIEFEKQTGWITYKREKK